MTATLRRGFKSEANQYALEYREELELLPADPLCPWKLAQHLSIEIVPLSHLRKLLPEQVTYLCDEGQEHYSGVTLLIGKTKRIIGHNDSNHKNRQASDIAHELAHIILGHDGHEVCGDRPLLRDAIDEEEARWLSGTLLIPREAAKNIIQKRLSIGDASSLYGVSEQLVVWRLNVTGVKKQFGKCW